MGSWVTTVTWRVSTMRPCRIPHRDAGVPGQGGPVPPRARPRGRGAAPVRVVGGPPGTVRPPGAGRDHRGDAGAGLHGHLPGGLPGPLRRRPAFRDGGTRPGLAPAGGRGQAADVPGPGEPPGRVVLPDALRHDQAGRDGHAGVARRRAGRRGRLEGGGDPPIGPGDGLGRDDPPARGRPGERAAVPRALLPDDRDPPPAAGPRDRRDRRRVGPGPRHRQPAPPGDEGRRHPRPRPRAAGEELGGRQGARHPGRHPAVRRAGTGSTRS